MTNKVLLNNVDHAQLKVAPRHGVAFGDAVNQLLVFPTEFAALQREFPILFRKDGEGAFQAVVLLGFDRDENLFLGEDGWHSNYVPAIQRRGPFSIAMQERREGGAIRREAMTRIDLDDPRVGTREGLPLFLPHGGNAPCLDHAVAALRMIRDGIGVAGEMFAAFEEAGLIEPVAIEATLDDATQYAIPGCYTIAEDRLAALDGAALERLHRRNFLYPAFLALSSLGNVARLIDLKNARRDG